MKVLSDFKAHTERKSHVVGFAIFIPFNISSRLLHINIRGTYKIENVTF